ncbi:hypothetical protein D3C76_1029880 [compost metagenome]
MIGAPWLSIFTSSASVIEVPTPTAWACTGLVAALPSPSGLARKPCHWFSALLVLPAFGSPSEMKYTRLIADGSAPGALKSAWMLFFARSSAAS